MSDDPINSADKTDEEAAAENNPAVIHTVELDHGEPSEVKQAEDEAKEAVKNDPWGSTPLQMRDVHDEAVDPELNEPGDGIHGNGHARVDPMEPQVDEAIAEDHGISGGTNAPA